MLFEGCLDPINNGLKCGEFQCGVKDEDAQCHECKHLIGGCGCRVFEEGNQYVTTLLQCFRGLTFWCGGIHDRCLGEEYRLKRLKCGGCIAIGSFEFGKTHGEHFGITGQ